MLSVYEAVISLIKNHAYDVNIQKSGCNPLFSFVGNFLDYDPICVFMKENVCAASMEVIVDAMFNHFNHLYLLLNILCH